MLLDYAINERDEVVEGRGLNAFRPYEPQKTQENMIAADAAWTTWNEIVEVLEEGEELFQEQEDEQ